MIFFLSFLKGAFHFPLDQEENVSNVIVVDAVTASKASHLVRMFEHSDPAV